MSIINIKFEIKETISLSKGKQRLQGGLHIFISRKYGMQK